MVARTRYLFWVEKFPGQREREREILAGTLLRACEPIFWSVYNFHDLQGTELQGTVNSWDYIWKAIF